MPALSRRDEAAASTRAALVDVALAHFARSGYHDASIESIVRDARVTRGALYHYFEDKKALFEEVVRRMQADMARQIRDAARRESDPWRRLSAGISACLDASGDSAYRRIVIEDGVSVLGWRRWRAIDDEYMLGDLKAALRAVIAAGGMERQPVDLLARVLSGAITEAAMAISGSDGSGAARQATALILDLLDSLRRPRPPTGRRSRPPRRASRRR